jgi:uncharacterized phage-like protein YoqJ
MKVLVATGHRRIGGTYDGPLHVALRGALIPTIRRAVDDGGFDKFISGMALGFDMAFAEAVLAVKDEGANIHLIAGIPFPSQPRKWPAASVKRYNAILARIPEEQKFVISPDPYADWKMQKRNIWMIDQGHAVCAGWTGVTKGGTYNAVEYATNKGLPILVKHPTLFIENWTNLK